MLEKTYKKRDVNDPRTAPVACGHRLRILRALVGLSRKALVPHGISSSTLQAWEEGKGNGLSKKGALRVIAAFQTLGIFCSIDWLLYDEGMGPRFANQTTTLLTATAYQQAEQAKQLAIAQELLTFRRENPQPIDMCVTDDGMLPVYRPGDYIGGCRFFDESDIQRLIGFDCIVETAFGDQLFRRVRPSPESGFFHLICINPDTCVTKTAIYNAKVASAAPVIWHRRELPFLPFNLRPSG